MKTQILKAKHWQLFILLSLPLIYCFFVIKNANDFLKVDLVIATLLYISSILFLLWQWSIGMVFYKNLPKHLPFSKKRFQFFLGYALIYSALFTLLLLLFLYQTRFEDYIFVAIYSIQIIIIPPLLFLISILYIIYKNAWIIQSIRLKRSATFTETIGIFISFCIFPLGIWFLQTIINKIHESYKPNDIINHLIE